MPIGDEFLQYLEQQTPDTTPVPQAATQSVGIGDEFLQFLDKPKPVEKRKIERGKVQLSDLVTGDFEVVEPKSPLEGIKGEDTPLFSSEWRRATRERLFELTHPDIKEPKRLAIGALKGTLEFMTGLNDIGEKLIARLPDIVPGKHTPLSLSRMMPGSSTGAGAHFISNEVVGSLEEEMNKMGHTIYGGIGELVPELAAFGKLEAAAKHIMPWLAKKSSKELSEMGVKEFGKELAKRAGKRSILDAEVFGAMEGIRSGGDPEAILHGVVAGATIGPVLEVGGVGGKRLIGPALKKLKKGKLPEIPIEEQLIEEPLTPTPKTIVPSEQPSKLQSTTDSETLFGKFWSGWVTNWDKLGTLDPALKAERKQLAGGRNKAFMILKDKFEPALQKLVDKEKVQINGKNKEPLDMAADLAEAIHTNELMTNRGWKAGEQLPKGQDLKNAEIFDTMNKMRASDNPKLNATAEAIDGAVKDMQAAGDDLLVMLTDTGVITPETAVIWREANPSYMPLQRLLEADAKATGGSGGVGSLKGRKGSTKEIRNVLTNLGMNYMNIIPWAEKQAFIAKAVEIGEKKGVIKKVGSTEAVKGLGHKVDKYWKDLGFEEKPDDAMKEAFKYFRQPRAIEPDEILYKQADKWLRARVDDPLLLKALKENPFEAQGMMKVIDTIGVKMKEWTRSGVTLVPEFTERNFIRDTLQSIVVDNTLSNGFWGGAFKAWPSLMKRVAVDYPRAMKDLIGNGEFAKDLQRHGAFGAEFHPSAPNINKLLNKMVTGNKIEVRFKNMEKNPFAWVEKASTIIEQTPRYTMAKRAYERELNKLGHRLGKEVPESVRKRALDKAAVTFRESTADFSEMGASARVVGRYVPFFTAGIAGQRTILRALQRDPAGFAGKMFSMITMPSLMLWYKNKDEKWYQGLNPVERNMYWHISENVRIPKPFDIGIIGGSLPEIIADRAYDWYRIKKGYDHETAKGSVLEDMLAMKDLVFPSIPRPPAASIVQGYFSKKDPFFKSRIEMPWEADKPAHERIRPSTSQVSRFITKKGKAVTDPLDLSPSMLDFAIKQIGGGLARYALKVGDFAQQKVSQLAGEELVEPKRGWEAFPLTKALVKKSPLKTTYSRLTTP